MITKAALECRRRRHLGRLHPALHHEIAVAGIAVVAAPAGFHVLAEILEDESRAALGALTVSNHGAKLGPVLDAALLVIRQVGTQIHLGEPILHALPAA